MESEENQYMTKTKVRDDARNGHEMCKTEKEELIAGLGQFNFLKTFF